MNGDEQVLSSGTRVHPCAVLDARRQATATCSLCAGTRLAMVHEERGFDNAGVLPREGTPAEGAFVKTKGEAMDPKNKFAAETVRQLQQSLDEVAPYQATELSKQQAIRMLSPQICTLRSKGYSWTAVAAMLSDRGVPVSVAGLRTYLRRVREEAANEAPRTPTKRLRDARADTRQPERTPVVVPSPSLSGETPPARKPPQSGAPPASAVTASRAPAPGTRA